MVNYGLLRIFWPSDIPPSTFSGVIVGWRNSEFDLFVVTILDGVSARNVEDALRTGVLFRNSPFPITRLCALCGRPAMNVLGSTNPPEPPTDFTPSHVYVQYDLSVRVPRVFCPSKTNLSIQVVTFERPKPDQMQYISLKPISLALADKHSMSQVPPMHDEVEEEEAELRAQTVGLVEKLKFHTVIRHIPTPMEQALPAIVNQINSSLEIDALFQQNFSLIGTRPKRSLSVSERMVESATTIWDMLIWGFFHVCSVWIYPVAVQVLIGGFICLRVIAELILTVLEWRGHQDAAALKDISATAQQIDIRLQQFCYMPIQYVTLRRRKNEWKSVTNTHPDYIRFYNSLWLVANDVIIGYALGSYIVDNVDWVASQINMVLTQYTVGGLQRTISWLMGWPAGLKLNNELAVFLGDLFLWVIERWAAGLEGFRPFLRHVLYVIGYSRVCGASMVISMFSDLLSILTIHIYSFYVASARIFNWQLTTIISLFHLFRGRKRNVLRNRIDYCDYDLDQLLLGTILFTVLFFLLPTVVVFYITFASARMILISLKALLDTCLAFLNHFPLFAVMLRVKDSKRLPGGICFKLLNPSLPPSHDFPSAPTSYIQLRSVPLSLRQMFEQYFQLGHRLRKHYLSPSVIISLLTGGFVPPIHRRNLYSLQYSMLPAKRIGIRDAWVQLTENRSHGGGGGGNGSSVGKTKSVRSMAPANIQYERRRPHR